MLVSTGLVVVLRAVVVVRRHGPPAPCSPLGRVPCVVWRCLAVATAVDDVGAPVVARARVGCFISQRDEVFPKAMMAGGRRGGVRVKEIVGMQRDEIWI